MYLPAFLLGVWHYAVVNRKNNKVGQITYDEWCPSTGGGPRDYTAHMGEGILDGLHVNVPESAEQDDTDDDVIIEVVPEDQGQAYQSEGPAQQNTTSVVNNNPIFIQQTGDGNMVIPNYGTININKR